MNSITDAKSLSNFPVLCRKAATASFGLYSNTVFHVPSLRNDDLEYGQQLKILNTEWFPSNVLESSYRNITYEGKFCHVHVGLEDDNRTISITYMGTSSITDMVIDLICILEVWEPLNPQIKVHAGFKKSYEESKEYVIKSIKELSKVNSITRLQFFGHSKGGAEATLAAYDLLKRTDLGLSEDFKISLLTFGQPHVGNEAFVEDFKARLPEKRIEKLVRFVNQFDPIPKLLDSTISGRYVHHCDALILDSYFLVNSD